MSRLDKQHIKDQIFQQGVLPLFYNNSSKVSIDITKALYKAGIRVIEYTNRGGAAVKNFKALKQLQQQELPDLILGIGTVKSANDAGQFINAGADFIISPLVNPKVAAVAKKRGYSGYPVA